MSLSTAASLRPPGGCSFAARDWAVLAGFWHPFCLSTEVTPAKPYASVLLDEDLVAYRSAGKTVVARDLCIHRGVPISMGWMENDEIVCPYHGFRYGADGQCTKVPAQPELPIPKKLCLQTFLVAERHGLVWVCLSGEPRQPLPEWPQLEDPGLKQMELPPSIWKCSSARHTENFNDLAHLSWLHAGTFGNREQPEVRKYEVEELPTGLHFESDYNRYSIDAGTGRQHLESIHYTYDLTFPFYTRLTVSFPDGRHFVAYDLPAPRSARQCNVLFRLTRDFDVDGPADYTLRMQQSVLAEDKPIVEAQKPEQLPLDLTEEFHIRADRFSTLYRKALLKLGLGSDFSA